MIAHRLDDVQRGGSCCCCCACCAADNEVFYYRRLQHQQTTQDSVHFVTRNDGPSVTARLCLHMRVEEHLSIMSRQDALDASLM